MAVIKANTPSKSEVQEDMGRTEPPSCCPVELRPSLRGWGLWLEDLGGIRRSHSGTDNIKAFKQRFSEVGGGGAVLFPPTSGRFTVSGDWVLVQVRSRDAVHVI